MGVSPLKYPEFTEAATFSWRERAFGVLEKGQHGEVIADRPPLSSRAGGGGGCGWWLRLAREMTGHVAGSLTGLEGEQQSYGVAPRVQTSLGTGPVRVLNVGSTWNPAQGGFRRDGGVRIAGGLWGDGSPAAAMWGPAWSTAAILWPVASVSFPVFPAPFTIPVVNI